MIYLKSQSQQIRMKDRERSIGLYNYKASLVFYFWIVKTHSLAEIQMSE